MKDYKINCIGMNDEQKRLVQDAFFKLGYCYYDNKKDYYMYDYYFAYSSADLKFMVGEDICYFENKNHLENHTELTFSELMKLANMEKYMTFTKADLKDGMVTKYRGGCHYANKYNGLSLFLAGKLIQADEFNTFGTLNDDLTNGSYKEFDIVEVFEVVGNVRSLENITHWKLKSIWKRPEPISAQQQAILDLEAKQQGLIDQAEKIKADIAKLKGM